jgi:hypothetical protein
MSGEDLARHLAWHRSHRPGAGAARSGERARAQQSDFLRRLLASDPSQGSQGTELVRTNAALAAAKARLAVLEARARGKSDDDNEEGVFS